MAAQTLSTFATMLKEHWLPPLVREFNLSTVLLDKLRRKSVKPVGGEYYLYPIHTQRNEAIGGRAEGAILPAPDKQTYNQAKLARFSLYGKFLISGWVLDAAKGDDTAIDVLDGEMVGLKQQMGDDLNRLLYGYGSAKYTNPSADSQSGTTINVTSTRHLRAGQEVGFAALANGTTGSEMITIATIASTTQITCDSVTSTGTADGLYPGDTRSTWSAGDLVASWNQAFVGIDGIVDTANPDDIDNARNGSANDFTGDGPGTYGNLERSGASAVDSWKGNVVDNSGTLRNLDIELMMQALHECEIDGGKPSLIITNHELWRRYGLIMAGNKTWHNNIQRLDGGWAYLDFVGIPVVADKHCPDNMMFVLDMNTFDLLIERELSFMDADGSIMVRCGTGITAYDQYEGTVIWRGALGCNKPNANCKIEDLSHTLV